MKYSISKANLQTVQSEIGSLWSKNFGDSLAGRYSWIYQNNPSGPPNCLLLKDNEHVVGATTLFPRAIVINRKCYKAGIAGDFVVDEHYRFLGPALSLQKSAISYCDGRNFDLLIAFPTQTSEPVLLRAGYRVLGEFFGLTKPLHSYYYLKKHFDIPIVTRMLAESIDLLMEVRSKEKYYRGQSRYTVETPRSFDRRFDTLWQKVSAQLPIVGERTSRYLNWRFKQAPHKRYQIFALIEEKARDLFGYVVYSVTEKKSSVHDLLCLNMGSSLDFLLSEFLFYQRRRGIDSVTIRCIGPKALVGRLKEYGFSIRDTKSQILIYAPPNSPLWPYLIDKENWYLMPCDNDV